MATSHLTPEQGDQRSAALVQRADLLVALEVAQLRGLGVGVVYIDLDRFHQVNTRWGQSAGDRVLELVAVRLADRLPAEALVASTEGDAFLILVPGADAATTQSVAEVLLAAIREPLSVESIQVSLESSAGIAHQGPGETATDLVEEAFLACRRAKLSAPGTAVGYELALSHQAARRQRTEEGLRLATTGGELRLHVQPTIDLRDGEVVGVEALVRWMHPVDGLLLPAEFLPVAETAGLMVLVGDWVLDQAIELARRWRTTRHGSPVRVWVNLAASQLADGDRLRHRVAGAIADGSITAQSIGFEVTESSLLEDLPGAVGVLAQLRALGVEIALDDFGTGYSSLSYLRQLPVTAVKIDRSFVAGIGGSLADEAIVEAVIDLAHALGMRVIAEGIEEVLQADALIGMGADEAQGYYFGRPEPPESLEPKLGIAWCGAGPPNQDVGSVDRRADHLPGFGSPRARLLLAALDTALDSIMVTASSGGSPGCPPIVYVNPAFEAETGYRSLDVIGKDIELLMPDGADDTALQWFRDVHESGRADTTEIVNRRADGSLFRCELVLSPISDERGVHTHWLHVRRDITQRRLAEDDRARFQGLIEQSSSLVFISETGGQWSYANAAQRRAIGLGPEDSLDGVNTRGIFSDVQMQLFDELVDPVLVADGFWSGPLAFIDPLTGVVTHVEMDLQMVADPLRPGLRTFLAVSRDVTDDYLRQDDQRRRRELGSFAAQLASRALDLGRDALFADMSSVLESFGELMQVDLAYFDVIDLDADLLRPIGGWSSDRFARSSEPASVIALSSLRKWVRRLESTRLLFHSIRDLTSQDWVDEIAAVFPGQPIGTNICAPIRADGRLLGLLGLARIDADSTWSDDEADTVQQVADTFAHLLSRKRADDALQASEAWLSAMLASVGDVLVVIDADGIIRYANHRLTTHTGHPGESVIGNHFLSIVAPDDHDLAIERFSQVATNPIGLPVTELRLVHADGSIVWYDADSPGVDDPLIGGFMISLRNISQQRAARESTGRAATFERVVLEISRWALEVESDDIPRGLDLHLERLGTALGTDSAFITLFVGDSMRNVAGWAASHAPDHSYELPHRDSYFPALAARFRTLDPLIVVDLHDHDDDWADEWRSFPVPDRSGLNIPLVSGGRCLGIIGVAMAHEPRAWTAEEVELVRRVSETVAAVLAQHQIETSLRASEGRLTALLDGSLDLVIVVGERGIIHYANGTARRTLGYVPSALIGTNVTDFIHPDDLARSMGALSTLLVDEPTDSITIRLRHANGSYAGSWEITSGVMRDPIAGGRVITARDVTDRLATEVAGAARIEHLRYALDLAQHALDHEPAEFLGRLSLVCEQIGTMLGIDFAYVDQLDEPRHQLLNLAGWVRDEATATIAPGQTISFDVVPEWVARLRMLDPIVVPHLDDLDERWVAEKRRVAGEEGGLAAIAMSAAGELLGVLGVSTRRTRRAWTADEVTFLRMVTETIAHVMERSRLDSALRNSEARFRLLAEHAADVIVLMDDTGTISYVSPSSVELLGYTPEEMIGKKATDFMHPNSFDRFRADFFSLVENGSWTTESRLRRKDGSWVWVASSSAAVIDPQTGQPTEFRSSIHDISDRKHLEAELERQALHDPLTGLGNRILLRSRLEVAVARRPPNDITVLLIDLDGFKEVNDTFGHAVGDDVLRLVAARLSGLTRPSDTLARTGGDEFVLLCPETDVEGGVAIAQRMIDAVSEPLTSGEITVRLGASVGVAHHRGAKADPDALLIEADHAMYAAKRSGRGRVSVAGDP